VSPRLASRKAQVPALSLALFVLVLGLASATSAARTPIAGPNVFTGKRLALVQFAGKPVFVNIWGSWCEGCTAEAPTLARFARAHRARVAFLGIDTIDSKAGARQFYKRFDTDYPSIWDPRGTLAGAWSRGAPTTLVFDRRHRLVDRIEGGASLAQLNAAFRRVTRS
jgi:thiol-disulfide isomerase/thioredoxin